MPIFKMQLQFYRSVMVNKSNQIIYKSIMSFVIPVGLKSLIITAEIFIYLTRSPPGCQTNERNHLSGTDQENMSHLCDAIKSRWEGYGLTKM